MAYIKKLETGGIASNNGIFSIDGIEYDAKRIADVISPRIHSSNISTKEKAAFSRVLQDISKGGTFSGDKGMLSEQYTTLTPEDQKYYRRALNDVIQATSSDQSLRYKAAEKKPSTKYTFDFNKKIGQVYNQPTFDITKKEDLEKWEFEDKGSSKGVRQSTIIRDILNNEIENIRKNEYDFTESVVPKDEFLNRLETAKKNIEDGKFNDEDVRSLNRLGINISPYLKGATSKSSSTSSSSADQTTSAANQSSSGSATSQLTPTYKGGTFKATYSSGTYNIPIPEISQMDKNKQGMFDQYNKYREQEQQPQYSFDDWEKKIYLKDFHTDDMLQFNYNGKNYKFSKSYLDRYKNPVSEKTVNVAKGMLENSPLQKYQYKKQGGKIQKAQNGTVFPLLNPENNWMFLRNNQSNLNPNNATQFNYDITPIIYPKLAEQKPQIASLAWPVKKNTTTSVTSTNKGTMVTGEQSWIKANSEPINKIYKQIVGKLTPTTLGNAFNFLYTDAQNKAMLADEKRKLPGTIFQPTVLSWIQETGDKRAVITASEQAENLRNSINRPLTSDANLAVAQQLDVNKKVSDVTTQGNIADVTALLQQKAQNLQIDNQNKANAAEVAIKNRAASLDRYNQNISAEQAAKAQNVQNVAGFVGGLTVDARQKELEQQQYNDKLNYLAYTNDYSKIIDNVRSEPRFKDLSNIDLEKSTEFKKAVEDKQAELMRIYQAKLNPKYRTNVSDLLTYNNPASAK